MNPFPSKVQDKRSAEAELKRQEAQTNRIVQAVKSLNLNDSEAEKKFTEVIKKFSALSSSLNETAKALQSSNESAPVHTEEVLSTLSQLVNAVASIEIKPEITVQPPDVKVPEARVDFKPLIKAVNNLKLDVPATMVDFSEVTEGVKAVEKAIIDLINKPVPVPEAPHAFKTANDFGTQALVDSDGHLQADILTMPEVAIDTSGLATETKQDTLIGHVDGIEGTLSTIDADTSALAATITSNRVAVNTKPDTFTPTTGTITGNGQTVSADVSTASNVMMYVTGTFATVNCTFEGSIDGGTSWFGVQAARSNANTVETTTGNLSAAPAYGWELSVNALTNVRVRSTAYSSGTQNWRFVLGAYATEPIPAVQTHAVTGSGNFAVTMAANATTTPSKARDGVAGATDTGIPAWFIRRDTPTNVTPAAGDYELAQIDSQGSQWVREKPSTTGTVTSVSGTTSSTSLLASNTSRRAASIYNDSTSVLYINLGATASSTAFTVKLNQDDYYEVPAGYNGAINGIWASATGSARITELS